MLDLVPVSSIDAGLSSKFVKLATAIEVSSWKLFTNELFTSAGLSFDDCASDFSILKNSSSLCFF